MDNKAPKMNLLYKISFILLFVCLAMFITAVSLTALDKAGVIEINTNIAVPIAVAGVIEINTNIAVLIAVAGVALCLVAIILTMFSKPMKPKMPKGEPEIDASFEGIDETEEIAVIAATETEEEQ